jgi:squalene-associated FAD-dependent desaturase
MDSLAHLDERLMPPHVAIIGGGYAGMAAAVTLAQNNIPVTIYEAGHILGGRARAVQLNMLTAPVDNGQHLLLGAYQTTLGLASLVHQGHAPYLRLPLALHTANGIQLHAPALLAPLNTLIALLRAKGLSHGERLAAITFMLRQQLTGFRLKQDTSVAQLLSQQPSTLIKGFWEPLCLAALNTPIKVASAQVFLNVLRDSLTRSQHDSDLIIPNVDLSEFFPQAAANYVTQHGGNVIAAHRVKNILRNQDGWTVDDVAYSHVICATAAHQVNTLIANLSHIAPIPKYNYEPIITVYLQYENNISLPRAMTGLVNTTTQWIFDRGITHQQHGLFAVVISASGAHENMQHEELAQLVAAELHQYLQMPIHPLWHQVIAEKRATFACVADIQRPSQRTNDPYFFLAGDYTASDYPATLEAATQSGVKCAHLIIENIAHEKLHSS